MTAATIRAVVAGFFLCLAAIPVLAGEPALERAVEAARASAFLPDDVVQTATSDCDTALCFGKALATALPDRVRLEKVDHPDTDSIRRVDTKPSVTAQATGDSLQLKLTHFGRKAVAELRAASAPGSLPAILDLRGNAGGDFERMLDVASLLLGSRRDVVEIDDGDRIERRSLTGPAERASTVSLVLIDEKTASAALLLARLLTAGGGADLVGVDDERPVFLKRRLAIDHDWRLILPVAKVRIAAAP